MSLLLPFRENAGGVGGRERVLGYREAFLISVPQGLLAILESILFLVAIKTNSFLNGKPPLLAGDIRALDLL